MAQTKEVQLELLLPDANQMSLDFSPDRLGDMQSAETQKKKTKVYVCIGNCDICVHCDSSSGNNSGREVV